MAEAKTHIRDIRLRNNAGMDVPVCKATAPLLDLSSTHWEFAQEAKDATCKVCRRRFPTMYPWARGFTLIEAMIVVAFIGMVVAMVLPHVSCVNKPTTKTAEDPRTDQEKARDEYSVQKLFEIDGCTVYSWWGRGERYFFSCPNGNQMGALQ